MGDAPLHHPIGSIIEINGVDLVMAVIESVRIHIEMFLERRNKKRNQFLLKGILILGPAEINDGTRHNLHCLSASETTTSRLPLCSRISSIKSLIVSPFLSETS